MSRNYIVIPAHFESKRLPGKVLLEETGNPLIYHTWRNALKAKYDYPECNFSIIIATDNDEIESRCKSFGATVMRTGRCNNGSERTAEIAPYLTFDNNEFNSVTTYQVDYPEIDVGVFPWLIKGIFDSADQNGVLKTPVTTLAYPSNDKHEYLDRDKVKVVFDVNAQALYFTRSPIPYGSENCFIHVGIYCWHYQAIMKYRQFIRDNQSPLMETAESLEQNKWLFYTLRPAVLGHKLKVDSINTSEDYRQFVKRQKQIQLDSL